MLRPAARRVALCNTGCSKLQGDVLHVAARRVAACNITRCRLQFRLLQVVARIGAGCRLSGCTLQHRALQVATRRVARCNTACCVHGVRSVCTVYAVRSTMQRRTLHFSRGMRRVLQARRWTPPPSRTPPRVQRSGCCLQRRRRRPLRVRLPVPRSVRGRCMDEHAACGPPRRTAVQAAPGRCTRVCGLRTGVQSTASASARTPSRAPPSAPRPRARSMSPRITTAARCPTCSIG